MPTSLTLTHWILSQQAEHKEAKGDLSLLLHSIAVASKFVSAKVREAGLLDLYGRHGSENVQGEDQQKLDVIANEAFIESLKRSGKVGIMCSEENEEAIVAGSGKYAVVFDPLDGSSNIDVNISIGTIFGIYRRSDHASGSVSVRDVLRPGRELVAAGYTMYGSATQLMLTFGPGSSVNGFTLDVDCGEFVLTHPDVRMPQNTRIYSANVGHASLWAQSTLLALEDLTRGGNWSMRYVGSMVADVHRTLLYGGLFLYPADAKNESGKLRLLYEANPMALLCENAGGVASTGQERILDLVPQALHQRVPVFLGCPAAVSNFCAVT